MNTIGYIFSFLCNQNASRSFEIGGQFLPFCQRCTGIYVGMGISFVYLLLSGHYKKGLPRSSILYANIASLLIMPVFGFHLLDPGPVWRFWTGLVFGNAIAFLILPAASIIWKEGEASGYHTWVSTILFWLLFGFLNTMLFWFPIQSQYFYYIIVIVALTGLLCLLFCIVAVIGFLVKKTITTFILKGLRNGYAKS
jgi:uncharacterized membrane protein